jgi:single-stranded DNA-binding protein
MAYYLNQFNCMGNLVADPELKNVGSDKKVCKFRIAVNNPHNESAFYFNIDVWGNEGEKCMLLKKGAQVFISNATLRPGQYEKTGENGQTQTVHTITINVDGYCGKVQFGPKVNTEGLPNTTSSSEVKKKRGRPAKKKASEIKAEAESSSPKPQAVEEDSEVLSFEEEFEF